MGTPRGLPIYKQRCDLQLGEVIERLRSSPPAVPEYPAPPPATAPAAPAAPNSSQIAPVAPQRSSSDLSSSRSIPTSQKPTVPAVPGPLPATAAAPPEDTVPPLVSRNATPSAAPELSPSMSQLAEHVLEGSLPSTQQATPTADQLLNEPLTNAQRITLETLVIMELHGMRMFKLTLRTTLDV